MHQVKSAFAPITSDQVFFGDKTRANVVVSVRYFTVENAVVVKTIERGTS